MLKRASKTSRLRIRDNPPQPELVDYPVLEGCGFLFSEVTEDGQFGKERFSPECKIDFPKKVFLLRDHDRGKILAKRGKNLTLRTDREGLKFSVDRLPKTALATETRELIKEGIIEDVSIGFIDRKSEVKDGVRVYKEIELHEISLLASGYFDSGKVSAREDKKPEPEPLPPECLL